MNEVTNAENKGLRTYVTELVGQGYRIQDEKEDHAQMVRPKKFSALWATLWFVFGLGFGIIAYIVYYMAKKDDLAYFEETGGKVTGWIEYTVPRYGRYAISFALWIGFWVLLFIGGSAGGGAATTIVMILAFAAVLGSIGFAVYSLLGWRRRDEIGA